jgi:hypothetical protein
MAPMREANTPRSVMPAVYKLDYRGRTFYRLGLYARDSQKKLAAELKVTPDKVQILDEGRKQ